MSGSHCVGESVVRERSLLIGTAHSKRSAHVGSHPCEYMFTLQIQYGMTKSKKCCSPGGGIFMLKVVTILEMVNNY